MKAGDLVNVNQKRGSGSSAFMSQLGLGLVVEIIKTPDITFGSVGPFNLGDDVAVQLSSGEIKTFHVTSLELIT